MREIIHFYSLEEIDRKMFEDFFADRFSVNEFVWVRDFYEQLFSGNFDNNKTYVSFSVKEEGFKYCYSVHDNFVSEMSLMQQVDILKALSDTTRLNLLTSDDEINPYSWILIEPGQCTATVDSTASDELIVEGFYNFPFGDFRMTERMTADEENILKDLVKDIYPRVQIEYSTDGPIINGDFNKAKNKYSQLKSFDYHYEIRPLGKNDWYSIEEKSQLFVELMSVYKNRINKELCLFPRNFSDIQNIPGGSDSEEYCLLLTGNNGREKIIYKRRRKSWI